jgi:hypothetical protein
MALDVLGHERLHVDGEVIVEAVDGGGDDVGVVDPELACFPGFADGRHHIRQCAAEPDAFGGPCPGFAGGLFDVLGGVGGAVDFVRSAAVGPFDQPAGEQVDLATGAEDFREYFGRQQPGGVGGDGGGEFAGERV